MSVSTDRSSEEENFKWIRHMAAALAFLHSCSVVHRDLKADKVLLTAKEDAKLADFGLAQEFIALTQIEEYSGDGLCVTSYEGHYMISGTGQIHWVAPEFFDGRYTGNADVFSLGTLFSQSWSGILLCLWGRRFTVLSRLFLVTAKLALGLQCIWIQIQSLNSHFVHKDPTLYKGSLSMLCSTTKVIA